MVEDRAMVNCMSRRFMFTDNKARTPNWDPTQMEYLVYQTESAPTTGTLHTQGYVRFISRKRINTAISCLGLSDSPPHLDVCKGNEEQCRAYCTKELSRVDGPHGEFGTYSATIGIQGKRTDLDTATKMIVDGSSMLDVAKELPKTFVQFSNGLSRLQTALKRPPPVERDVLVTVLWGSTGTGKTHRCYVNFKESLYVVHGHPAHPWDQYNGQEAILLDEFNPLDWAITDILPILDKWPYPLSCRYNNQSAFWTDVIIASNTDPSTWYSTDVLDVNRKTYGLPNAEQVAAFRRRLTHVVQVHDREQEVLFARAAREANSLNPFQ